MNTNKIWWSILVAVLFAGGVYYFFIREEGSTIEPSLTKTEEASISDTPTNEEITVEAISNKYNTSKVSLEGLHYSYQLEDALVNRSSPIVFVAEVEDISRENGQIQIKFASSLLSYEVVFFDEPPIQYVLNGCEEKVSIIEGKIRADYAVVAKITGVKKAYLQVDATSDESGNVELEYEPSDLFIATGECIDLEYIEGTARTP